MQVALRGESMQAAADAADSGMVSVIGLDADTVASICAAANERVGGANAVQVCCLCFPLPGRSCALLC